jgi:O-antigen ligase
MSPTSTIATLRPVPVETPPTSLSRGEDRLTPACIALAFAAMPILVPQGPGNLAPADVLALLVVGAMLLRLSWTHERVRLPYLRGAGLLAVAGASSALLGELPGGGLLAVTQDLFLFVWAAALTNFARTDVNVRFLASAWALTASAWAVVFIATAGPGMLKAGGGAADPVRAAFTFGDENGAGFYFAVSILVVLATQRPRRGSWRLVAVVCLGLATLGTGSLGAISGLLAGVAVAVVLGLRSRRGAALALVLTVALPAGVASGVLFSQRHEVVQAAHESDNALLRNSLGRGYQSSSSRAVLAQETYTLFQTSNVWGRGPVATQHALRLQQAPYPKEAHNDWLAALVERGALGIVGLLVLVLEIGLWGARTWDRRRLAPGFAAAFPAPHFVVGALVTGVIFSFTHEVLHDRTLWAVLGLIAAIGIWGHDRPVARTEGRP